MNTTDVTQVEISKLKYAEYNPREITDEAFINLQNSIKEFGFVEPAVVNKDNTIIGGHMRVRASEALGWTKVPVLYVDLPEDKAKMLNLALNRITGRWDTEKLGKLITDLTLKKLDLSLTGFEKWELQYYNQGETPNYGTGEGGSGAGGEIPNEAIMIIFSFADPEQAEAVGKFFNDGKFVKGNDGAKLYDFLKQGNYIS